METVGVRGAEELTGGTVAAIGEPAALAGYTLVGVRVHSARDAAEAHAAWDGLPDDVVLVLVAAAHADALAGRMARPGGPLSVVIPR
jgi:vacuolar-type H+-ATPase subunit F/Vma7